MKTPQTSELIRNPRFLQILILVIVLLVGACLFVFLFTQLTPLQNMIGARASATPVLPPTAIAQTVQTVIVVATSPPTFTPLPSPTALPSATATPTMTPTATRTLTNTVTLTGTLAITITPTITTTATITTTSSITATTTPTATPAITVTATVTATRPPAPKGSIAYRINENGTDRLRVLNLENNNNTPFIEIGPVMDIALRTNAAFGAWSPDNSKFAYIWTDSPNSSNILRVIDFKLGTTRSIYSPDTGGGLSSPTWSPDGTKIALIRLSSKQIDWSVIAVNVDATRCSNKYECEITSNTQGEQFRGGLAWASQGLFVLSINTTGANEVFTMWSDGGGRTNLTNNAADDTTPTWSPDGKLIAFTSNRDGHPQIYVMNPDGSNLRKLSRGDTPDFEPTWSPDGKWIAFASVRNNATDIYMMDLNGNNVTRLTTNGGDRPIWTR